MMPNFSVRSEPTTRPISGGHELIIPATTGKRTLIKAANVFPGGVLGHEHGDNPQSVANFRYARKPFLATSSPTPAMPVVVHEMIRDGDFMSIFNGLAWFTQDQVIAFVETHVDWIHPSGRAVFFPFAVPPHPVFDIFNPRGERHFVALVDRRSDGRLRVNMDFFAFEDRFRSLPFDAVDIDGMPDSIWVATGRGRLVVPQLTTLR